ncbi:MAG: cysteine--tRNA ligase, partial [Pseudomonadota bacterium]
MTLYNTLTREKTPFMPIDRKNVRMYVCGPTVYDYAHIGNARPVIVFDVLFRLLRHVYGDVHVTYVRNITDVDDKINARALETHGEAIAAGTMSLNEAIREVTEKTANQFQSDMKALGCIEPTHQPRATEFVLPREDGKADMESMIQTLLDKRHAYIAKGTQGREVLFRVNSMEDYGALSNRKLEDQQAGARVAVEVHKENAGDFVLWKESNATEPGWDGTFNGEVIHGRPGWHIECSAMSEAYLGQTFDIHGGGLDLIFPHHENEIAQSRCCHGTDRMANVWMHNGFLQVEGKKMSKSEGNFHTVYDVLHTEKVGGRRWPGEVVRLAMLMTHYREPIDFSVRRLEEAENLLARLRRKAGETKSVGSVETFIAQLADDLDCTAIMRTLSSMSGEALQKAADLLGLDLAQKETAIDVQAIVTQRLALIADKNWVEAD